MKISNQFGGYLILFLFLNLALKAETFTSIQTGDWSQSATWDQGSIPDDDDDIIILSGHTVTINGSAYTHEGNITIQDGGKLIANTGDSDEGFTFEGAAFHLYGELELPLPPKDFTVKEEAIFWVHPTASISISDDWIIEDKSQTILESVCVDVSDDFHIVGKEVSLCGSGGVSLGNSSSQNKLRLDKGAKTSQICAGTNVYRGSGSNCITLVSSGTGTNPPLAEDDFEETDKNTALPIYVLSNDDDNEDGDDEILELWAAGSDGMNGQTDQGGIVTVSKNGTPEKYDDDFIEYSPPLDFSGSDFFEYIITDRQGAYAYAIVEIAVKTALPVTLIEFKLEPFECQVNLSWITSGEQNNDYFEIERSVDGQYFTSFGKLPGRGTSNDLQYYQFKDPEPASMNYYRLRQVDYDETFTFSEIISFNNPCINNDFDRGIVSLYPNPATSSSVFLKINGSASADTQLYVTDIMGNILHQEVLDIGNGIAEHRLNVSAYPAGTYFVHFDKKTKRFIKVID